MIKIILILSLFIISCTNSSLKENKIAKKTHPKLIVVQDYETFNLPEALKEISGLTFINDSLVAAVEDEHGIVYFYDLVKEKISKKISFHKDGDYEDIIQIENDLWVVNNAGDLFQIQLFESETPEVQIFKTQLKKKNDIEGLTYDKTSNSLLLSVKEKNLDSDKNKKDIYRFDIKTKTLDTKAFLQIDLDELESEFKGDAVEQYSKNFLKAMGNENLKEIVKPTALAIHPLTKDLYILSSINNVIIVYGQDKLLKKVISFHGPEFSQPEGLSFNSKGELYISNEGHKNQGNIIKIKNINAN